MRAVQLTAPGQVAIREVPEPHDSGLAVVRSETMGICGTDLKVLHGDIPVDLPRTLGHELVGRIVHSSDPRLSPGTRVLADPALACGTCGPCLRGRPNLCRKGGLMGREVEGVFADLVAVDPRRLLVVPDEVSAESAGLLQVLGTCVHGLSGPDLFGGDVALVLGLGVTGQLMVRLLAAAGLAVVGVTRSENKRQLAAANGAIAVAGLDEAAGVLAEVSGGEGPALVVEAVGLERTLARAIELAGVGAGVVAFGTLTGGGEGLPYYDLYYKELTLWNPRAALLGDYARAIELVSSGTIRVDDIVTHSFSLDEAHRAFELAEDPASLKVLIAN
jgi:2-desacetyl-2-hydroxyethyl bacteriochlorophyllide A dehydrogenase